MAQNKKAIYVDSLREAICNDHTIRGTAFASVMRHINAAPAADVAPIVHGRWIKDTTSAFTHRYNCSVCNFRLIGLPEKYCPGCGAVMDLPMITDATASALERMGVNTHGGSDDGHS